MKQLKCPSCGAPINRATMRCDYCGAVFKEENNALIVLEHPKVIPLCAEVMIDNHMAMYDGCENYVMDALTEKLAKAIANYMEVKVQDYPWLNQKAVRGRVRIVLPNTRL